MPDVDLSPNEVTFLAYALDGPLLAFQPMEDEMISGLLDRKLVALRPDADPEHGLLDLTEAGRAAVERQLRSPSFSFPI